MQSGFQELLDEFLLEARERTDEVEALLLRIAKDPLGRKEAVAQAKRELHTLKGNSGMMGFSDLQQIAHRMEDQVELLDLAQPVVDDILARLDSLRSGLDAVRSPLHEDDAAAAAGLAATPGDDPEEVDTSDWSSPEQPSPADVRRPAQAAGISPELARAEGGGQVREAGASVRVPFSKIDRLVELQAETLIFRNRLADAVTKGLARAKGAKPSPETAAANLAAWDDVDHARQALEKTLNQLQEQVTSLGMVPLQSLFRSLGRIVHDESRREGKTIDFEVQGGDTPIDKTLLEAAGDALGHLVRNAVVHGIERPEARRRKGKRERGNITVSATLESGEVRIEVSDDGAGIDAQSLRAKAQRIDPSLAASSSDVALLFEEGISTREDADLGAGRGVGLSAVKKSVEGHGGRIRVRSQRGAGTTFALHLPVTASILRVLVVRIDGEDYALSLTAVSETLAFGEADVHEVNGAAVVRWRGQLLALLDLGAAFGTAHRTRGSGFIVVLEINGRMRGLVIEGLVGIRDIVVKSLDSIVGQHVGISGATILGDGRVIMILDPSALVIQRPSRYSRIAPAVGAAPGSSDLQ
jgi:two-component system chemotaxis sensor kinase CheA